MFKSAAPQTQHSVHLTVLYAGFLIEKIANIQYA